MQHRALCTKSLIAWFIFSQTPLEDLNLPLDPFSISQKKYIFKNKIFIFKYKDDPIKDNKK